MIRSQEIDGRTLPKEIESLRSERGNNNNVHRYFIGHEYLTGGRNKAAAVSLGAKYGIHASIVKNYGRFTRSMDAIGEKHGKDVQVKMLAGHIPCNVQLANKFVRLPEEIQRRALEEGNGAVKEAIKIKKPKSARPPHRQVKAVLAAIRDVERAMRVARIYDRYEKRISKMQETVERDYLY